MKKKELQEQINIQAKQIMLINKRHDLLLEIINIDRELIKKEFERGYKK